MAYLVSELKAQVLVRGAWEQLNPAGPDRPYMSSARPKLPPSIEELIMIENKHRVQLLADWKENVRETKGPRPQASIPLCPPR
ncbi:uncharacterized protein RAG0_06106 [Rhynchosporium agropyri]|uniref:Uncharacterized protein n=1 Tax=Rhynchosporium agropyri TaxID=914238 RepID=A0A1E1KG23_9HELO|nr:uncharacterized protein RAG0_06106 [Rhynchosporium agropyri]